MIKQISIFLQDSLVDHLSPQFCYVALAQTRRLGQFAYGPLFLPFTGEREQKLDLGGRYRFAIDGTGRFLVSQYGAEIIVPQSEMDVPHLIKEVHAGLNKPVR